MVHGLRFMIYVYDQGSWFMVEGLEFWGYGLWFAVSSFGCRVKGSGICRGPLQEACRTQGPGCPVAACPTDAYKYFMRRPNHFFQEA